MFREVLVDSQSSLQWFHQFSLATPKSSHVDMNLDPSQIEEYLERILDDVPRI